MSSTTTEDNDYKAIARRWMEMEEIKPVATTDRLLPQRCHLKHVAWKFNETFNQIWIDGRLGVVFTADQPSPSGELQTKVDYEVEVLEEPQKKTQYYAVEIAELAKWHLAWLTDPNVWIDSATIDMEFDQKLLVEKRKFQVKEVNINVMTNYPSIHGWLQHMFPDVESLVFRGNGIMDANRFLQLPFAVRLRKLLIIYESSFDDRLILQLTAEHLQIASDFLTEGGINKLLHRYNAVLPRVLDQIAEKWYSKMFCLRTERWNDLNYPARSEFVIYVRVKNPENVVKNLEILERKKEKNGVSEFLIEMTNPNTRMRVITRPSSVICNVFAVDNSQAPPPLATPVITPDMN
ncbi:hypothetical protein CAEBREN_18650 [Caenorhabditis brenneri]|uniref:Uncharacterized protein n=1 Tax=Caenorhabditis brenneri TaxID=135651 RepID=G0NIP4_CAEBE|nr:hypothetical protein CAEBREN_18650 [Caenorhabditis brenneri]